MRRSAQRKIPRRDNLSLRYLSSDQEDEEAESGGDDEEDDPTPSSSRRNTGPGQLPMSTSNTTFVFDPPMATLPIPTPAISTSHQYEYISSSDDEEYEEVEKRRRIEEFVSYSSSTATLLSALITAQTNALLPSSVTKKDFERMATSAVSIGSSCWKTQLHFLMWSCYDRKIIEGFLADPEYCEMLYMRDDLSLFLPTDVASYCGNIEALQAMGIETLRKIYKRKDEEGSPSPPSNTILPFPSPLYLAAGKGNFPLIKWLLELSADDDTRKPLFDIDSRSDDSSDGVTPLLAACAMGHTAAALMLIEAGASLDRKSIDGSTPRSIAWENGMVVVMTVIDRIKMYEQKLASSRVALSPSNSASQLKALTITTPPSTSPNVEPPLPSSHPPTSALTQALKSMGTAEQQQLQQQLQQQQLQQQQQQLQLQLQLQLQQQQPQPSNSQEEQEFGVPCLRNRRNIGLKDIDSKIYGRINQRMVLQICKMYAAGATLPNGLTNTFPFEIIDFSADALSRITTTDDARIAYTYKNSRSCPGSFNGAELPVSLPYRVVLGTETSVTFIDEALADLHTEPFQLSERALNTTEARDIKLIYEASTNSEIVETIMELMQLVAEDYEGNQVLVLFASEVMEHKWDVVCRVAELNKYEREHVEDERLKERMLSLYFLRSWTQNVIAIARVRMIHSKDGNIAGFNVVECEFASMGDEPLLFKIAVIDFLIKRLVLEIPVVHPLDPKLRSGTFPELLAASYSVFGAHGLMGSFNLSGLINRRCVNIDEIKIPRRLQTEPTNEIIHSWYNKNQQVIIPPPHIISNPSTIATTTITTSTTPTTSTDTFATANPM